MIAFVDRPWELHSRSITMESKEEPSSTFNINLLTGDLTFPVTMLSTGNVLAQEPEANQMLPPPTSEVPSSSKSCGGKVKSPGKLRANEALEKNTEEYIQRRQRNNVSVKKSRARTREKSVYTLQKVEELKIENEQLESKITILTKELGVLKELFMDHARGFSAGSNANLLCPDQLRQLESLLGCKVIKTEANSTYSAPGTSTNTSVDSMQAVSTIQPLINVAELELMSFNNDRYFTNVTEVSTQDAVNIEHMISLNGDTQGTSDS